MLYSIFVALRVRIARRRFNQAADAYAVGIRLAQVADDAEARRLFLEDLDPLSREVACEILADGAHQV